MADEGEIIHIKKVKKGGHAHHGGAWKVAYADFVTAMMAFFLLLWLLSTTSQAQKEGIAEYFTPTQGLKDSKGIGFEGGTASEKEGTKQEDRSKPAIVVGRQPQGPIPNRPEESQVEGEEADAKLFEKAEKEMKKAFFDDPTFREFKDNIIVEQSPEGLKIEIIDDDKKPMFHAGQIELSEYGQRVLGKMAKLILKMPNFISITGHTDASIATNPKYGNWELSADRANASRRFLITSGMEAERVGKIVGMADRELLMVDDPKNSRNRRITIILLRGSHMNLSNSQMSAPRSLLSGPKTSKTESLFETKPDPVLPPKEVKPGEKLNEGNSSFLAPGQTTPGLAVPPASAAQKPVQTMPKGVMPIAPKPAQVAPAEAPPPSNFTPPDKPQLVIEKKTAQ